jgi:hypothetical protein
MWIGQLVPVQTLKHSPGDGQGSANQQPEQDAGKANIPEHGVSPKRRLRTDVEADPMKESEPNLARTDDDGAHPQAQSAST